MPPRNFTDEEEEQIVKIYLAGHSVKSIMRAYGYKYHLCFVSALKRQGVEQRSKAERNRLYQIDAHIFDVIDTEEKAYWWGFIYADGNIHKRSLTVCLKRSDRNQLVKLKSFLKSEHPIKEIMANCSNNKKYKQSYFFATDQHLASRLKELGVIPKRGKFNKAVIHLPAHLEQHWIRGYFDGDGSARKPNPTRGPSIVFCGSKILLEWIRDTTSKHIGTNPNLKVTKHSRANIYYLHFSGVCVANEFASWIYKNATIWLARKRKVVDNWPLPLKDPYLRERDKKGRFS